MTVRMPVLMAALVVLLAPTPTFAQFWMISGQVVDGQGVGVSAVDIDLFAAGTNDEFALSQDFTNAQGTFALTIVTQPFPAGLYDVQFKAPPGSNYFDHRVENVFIGGNVDLGVIPLPSGWFLSGRVIDEQGIGLAGMDLQVIDETGEVLDTPGDDTDALGFYSVLVPEGTLSVVFRQVQFFGPLYVPVLIEGIVMTADTMLPDVTLLDGHVLTGTVRDSGGFPVVGADVDVFDALTGDRVHTPDDNTGPTGTFSVLVPLGDWEIEIEAAAGVPLVPQVVPFTVQLPPAVNDLGIVSLQDGVFVTGITVDGAMVPVPEVDLDFVITATQTPIVTLHDNADATGQFSVLVEPGVYDVIFKPGFATGLAPLVLPSMDVGVAPALGSVILPAGLALTGTVTDGTSPVADVEVSLTDPSTGDPVFTFSNDTDGLGQYAVRQVPATYDVHFTPLPTSGLPSLTVPGVVLDQDTVLDVVLGAPQAPPPVVTLACPVTTADVFLTWANGAPDYDLIEVRRDGAVVATLAGDETSYLDSGLADGVYTYTVVATRSGLSSPPTSCTATVDVVPGASDFIRGDADGDGAFNGLLDGIFILNFQFIGGTAPPCEDAADFDDDGVINGLIDGIGVLLFQFSGGAPPAPPFPAPGPDPTPDSLLCP